MSERPPVLLLHGIPGSRSTWARVEPMIAHSTEPLVPDLLGFGDAPDFIHDGHAAEQADRLIQLLDEHRIDSAHVVGFDFGGPTAVLLYRKAPHRVRSLVLAATNVFTDTPVPLPLRIARVPLAGDVAFRAMFSTAGLFMMWFGATGDRQAFSRKRFFDESGAARGIRTARHIFLLSLRDLRRYYSDVERTLADIDVPTTVVWGDRDPFFPIDEGKRMHGAIPGAIFRVLEGCGHFIPGERPSELAAIIEQSIYSSSSKIAKRR